METLTTRGTYLFGEFQLNLDMRVLTRQGTRVALGSKAYEVLTCLVLRAGEVVSKSELLKEVWPGSFVEEGTLSQHVFSLRKALGDRADFIVTIPGQGYRFMGAVRHTLPQPYSSADVVHEVRERTHLVIEEPVIAPAAQKAFAGRPFFLSITAALTATCLIAVWAWHRHNSPSQFHSVVVADFANTTGDPAFDSTMRRALEIDLEQSPSLDVMGEGEASGVLQSMGQKSDATLQGEVAREVCIRSNRQVLLRGAIASVGSSYLLTLEATDCPSGTKLAGAKASAKTRDDVLNALDSVADQVRSRIGESAKSLQSYDVPIQLATTTSLEALKAFSIALTMDDQSKDQKDVLVFYQRAVELDPNFAMAYGGLGNAYYNLNQYDLSEQAFKKAFELSRHGTAKEKLILDAASGGGVGDAFESIRAYKLWGATYPHETAPWVDICNNYTQVGQDASGVYAGEHAVAQAPDYLVAYAVLVRAYKRLGQFDNARAVAAKLRARGKDSTAVHMSLFDITALDHDPAAMGREVAWFNANGDSWSNWVFPDEQASAAAADGQLKSAEALFRNSIDRARTENIAEAEQLVLEDQMFLEFELGDLAATRATISRLPNPDRDTVNIALVKAKLGDPAAAERFLKTHQAESHPNTMLAYADLPRIRATLAMLHGKPLDAIKALEPATPVELANFTIPTLRAAAYMQAGQPQNAVPEYRKILAHPGSDTPTPLLPLAHLGLARAYAASGNKPGARAEYTSFLAAWNQADPDLPALRTARLELAALR